MRATLLTQPEMQRAEDSWSADALTFDFEDEYGAVGTAVISGYFEQPPVQAQPGETIRLNGAWTGPGQYHQLHHTGWGTPADPNWGRRNALDQPGKRLEAAASAAAETLDRLRQAQERGGAPRPASRPQRP